MKDEREMREMKVKVKLDDTVARSARNIPGVKVLPVAGLNVYDILNHEKLVLTRAAVEAVVEKATKMSGKSLGLQTVESAQAGGLGDCYGCAPGIDTTDHYGTGH